MNKNLFPCKLDVNEKLSLTNIVDISGALFTMSIQFVRRAPEMSTIVGSESLQVILTMKTKRGKIADLVTDWAILSLTLTCTKINHQHL